ADLAASLVKSGLETIGRRHTCRHRVDELFGVLAECGNRQVLGPIAIEETVA
ncbi:MAG: glycosyltransferase, partial [Mesorhizobium sp.]